MVNYNAAEVPQVLVVEDNTLLRTMAVDLVTEECLTAFAADGADNALEQLAYHGQIGIVLTDIDMPGSMDGLALAHLSKALWPHLQHIIVSGRLTLTPDQLPEGARFFAKPYPSTLLGKTLRAMADVTNGACYA